MKKQAKKYSETCRTFLCQKLKFSYLFFLLNILASDTDFESHLSLFLNMVSHDQLCDAQELLFLALLASNLCNTFSSSIFEYEWNIWICKWYLRATEGKKSFVTQMLFSNTQSYFIYGLTRTWPLLLIAHYSHNLHACLSKIDLARIKIKKNEK